MAGSDRVEPNGDDPGPTPHRWRLTITWSPAVPGVGGLHEVMFPIVRFLAWLDRSSDRHIAIHVGTLEDPDAQDP